MGNNGEKEDKKPYDGGKAMFDLFGNNMLGFIEGGSNDIIEEAMDKIAENPDDLERWSGFTRAIVKRLWQGASVLIAGNDIDGKFLFEKRCSNETKGYCLPLYTSFERKAMDGGKDWLMVPMD